MSAHVLLNLLNELGKKIRCEALPSILSVFPNEFNKFSYTGAQMQVSIDHMTLKLHFISEFRTKTLHFGFKIATFLWKPTHYDVIYIFDPLVDYSF